MPKNVKDHDKWEKAKQLAGKEGRADDYAYISGIYKQMGGEYTGGSDLKKALDVQAETLAGLASDRTPTHDASQDYAEGQLREAAWLTVDNALRRTMVKHLDRVGVDTTPDLYDPIDPSRSPALPREVLRKSASPAPRVDQIVAETWDTLVDIAHANGVARVGFALIGLDRPEVLTERLAGLSV